MDETQERLVKELEASKERLIHSYLELQDQADDLNGRIYHLCCEIETLNRRIAALRSQPPPPNGSLSAPAVVQKPNQIPPMA